MLRDQHVESPSEPSHVDLLYCGAEQETNILGPTAQTLGMRKDPAHGWEKTVHTMFKCNVSMEHSSKQIGLRRALRDVFERERSKTNGPRGSSRQKTP